MLPTYLERRKDKGRNIYIRMVAPRDIAAFLPPDARIFRKSLRTADVREAALRSNPIIHSKLGEWDKIRKQRRMGQGSSGPVVLPTYVTGGEPTAPDEIVFAKKSLTSQLIKTIVAARAHAWVALDDEERPTLDDEGFAEVVAFSRMSEAELRNFIARGAQPQNNSHLIEQVFDTAGVLGVRIDEEDPLFHQLVREFAIGEARIHELINKRNTGDWPDTDEFLPKAGTFLSVMTDVYRKHKLATAGAHYVGSGVSVWQRLIEYKGDVFLNEVSSRDVYEFMDHHLRETKRWSPKYLSKVRTYLGDIFSLGITLSYFAGPNPILALERMPQLPKTERASRNKPRYPLTTEKINSLFSSEWYNSNASHWKGQLGQDLGARYFMPLICLLHGPRVREPLQLMTDEIVERDRSRAQRVTPARSRRSSIWANRQGCHRRFGFLLYT